LSRLLNRPTGTPSTTGSSSGLWGASQSMSSHSSLGASALGGSEDMFAYLRTGGPSESTDFGGPPGMSDFGGPPGMSNSGGNEAAAEGDGNDGATKKGGKKAKKGLRTGGDCREVFHKVMNKGGGRESFHSVGSDKSCGWPLGLQTERCHFNLQCRSMYG